MPLPHLSPGMAWQDKNYKALSLCSLLSLLSLPYKPFIIAQPLPNSCHCAQISEHASQPWHDMALHLAFVIDHDIANSHSKGIAGTLPSGQFLM